MSRIIRSLISRLVFFVKKKDFKFDEKIPLGYLIRLSFERVAMLLRGYCYLKLGNREKFFFVGKNTRIKCSQKISIENGVLIDRNCYIDAMSINGIILRKNTSVGMNTTIICSGTLKNIGVGLTVGCGVGMGTHGFYGCAGGIKIGDNSIFGNFVTMHSENHNYSDDSILIKDQGVNRKGIVVGDNCWIGAKATILDGVIIENGVIIAAGALVTEGKYKCNGIYGGVPAKLIKMRVND